MQQSILLTGCAGFIGSHLLDRLLADGHKVIGVDDFNDFYSPSQKHKNIQRNLNNPNFKLIEKDICNLTMQQFSNVAIDCIVHLAARAGVRPSLKEPLLYEKTNVGGTLQMLELAKNLKTRNFIFGSSSSVYGNNTLTPFREDVPCDQPISPYATTKRSAELLCQTYNYLYKIPTTILRFFTVYGPRNRPDMAAYKFIDAIAKQKPISIYGENTSRDYTFIDDIVSGIVSAIDHPFSKTEIINLGNSSPVTLKEFISVIEKVVGKKAILNYQPLPPGDVQTTYADITKARKLLKWQPKTDLLTGFTKLWQWYSSYKHPN